MVEATAKWSGMEIVKNGQPIAKVRTGDNAYYSSATNVATAQLAKGDDVWVRHIRESDNNVLYGLYITSFTGHLV